MRVSSLSDRRVIALISKYFVPAWVSRDDYQLDPRSKAEQSELERIDADRHKRGLEGGTVCVFVLDPDGRVLATQPVQLAYKAENLLPFLTKIIADKQLTARSAEAVKASAAEAPSVEPKTKGGRFIHIRTRCDQAGTNRGLSHDRVELSAIEWKSFLPPADARPDTSWKLPDTISHKLFRYCYPPGPQWRAKDCKVLSGRLTASPISATELEARIRLEGEMELSFPYTGKPTDGRISAHLVGFARYSRRNGVLTSLMLVSEKAEYVWYWKDKPQPIEMRISLELEP